MEKMEMKLCIVGPPRCGKTLICKLLADQVLASAQFYRSTEDSGVRIQEYSYRADGNRKLRVQLWDCAGTPTVRSHWKTLSRGLDGIVLVHDSKQPSQESQLELFYKSFAQPHKLTVTQCLVLGVNLSGGYSMGRALQGAIGSLPHETVDISPANPETAAPALKAVLDKLIAKCLKKNHDRQKAEIEEEVLEAEP